MELTIIIHTCNEEKNIGACIDSAKLLSDKIIIIDMESTDKTKSIAKNLKTQVFNFPLSNYVEPARKFGVEKAEGEWVLILDVDERLTLELAKEIKSVIKNPKISHYQIPRKNIFAGEKWLKHGGWWQDYQIRLINKKFFVDWPKEIHSTPKIKGEMAQLKNPLTHYFHGDLEKMVEKTIVFENIESDLLFRAGKNVRTPTFFRKFAGELNRRLILNFGFLDGSTGVIESIYQAFSKTITYLFLYEKKTCPPAGRISLYDPYLDTLGGGEKHVLSILKVFDEIGYEVFIFWDKDLTMPIKERFNLTFKNISYVKNIFRRERTLEKLKVLKNYDFFIYVTDGSYFFSSAKKNYVFTMVPQKNLYQLNLLNRLKLKNFTFITNSKFTQDHIKQWGIESSVVYPYIDQRLIETDINQIKKEKIILSVGRFFPHLHSKNQTQIVQSFNRLKQKKEFSDFRLILAGGLKNEDKNYFDQLKKTISQNKSVELKINISYEEMNQLYKKAMFYWHFTGYKIDENKQPEAVEHLGIAPLEAMASGCITFCFQAGGAREFIKDETNGFFFKTEEELINKMLKVIVDNSLQENMIVEAKKTISDNFSYPVFKTRVKQLFKINHDFCHYPNI